MPTTIFAFVLFGFGAWLAVCAFSAFFIRSQIAVAESEPPMPEPMTPDDEIVSLECQVRGETYIVRFRRETLPQALSTLGKWANNRELDFNWQDATAMAMALKAELEEECCGK